jgi:hypothetical protein
MVIGGNFAWAHMGKTGGDATLAMFRAVPRLIAFADPDNGNDKHADFQSRWALVKDKALLLNIRRLPHWIVSFARHQATRGLWPDYKPLPMMSGDEMAASTAPDNHLSIYTHDQHIPIDRWLRTEMLAEDFIGAMTDIARLTDEEAEKVRAVGMVNAATYDHDVSKWLTRDQVRLLYFNNPHWSAIEKVIYGSTI